MNPLIILFSSALMLSACNNQKACICTTDYNPVCGSDGKTYTNGCLAECAGVAYTPGSCDSNGFNKACSQNSSYT